MKRHVESIDFPNFLNDAPYAVFCTDANGVLLSLNSRALMYFDAKNQVSIIGKPIVNSPKSAVNREFSERNCRYETEVWMAGAPMAFLYEYVSRSKKSTGIPNILEILKFPVFDSHGYRKNMFTIINNATENGIKNNLINSLSTHLDISKEDERKNLARDVHDVLGNMVTSIKMTLGIVSHYLQANNNEIARKHLDQALELCEGAADQVRRISSGLRPSILDEFGLYRSLEWLIDDSAKKNERIAFKFKAMLDEATLAGVPESISTCIFRIAQEALGNAIKHSTCDLITLSLSMKDRMFIMRVANNGTSKQSEESKGGLGLFHMRERARSIGGKLLISSSNGFSVRLQLNLDDAVDTVNRGIKVNVR